MGEIFIEEHKLPEGFPAYGVEGAILVGAGVSGAGSVIHEGHFPEVIPRLEDRQRFFSHPGDVTTDPNLSLLDDKEAISRFVVPEDKLLPTVSFFMRQGGDLFEVDGVEILEELNLL